MNTYVPDNSTDTNFRVVEFIGLPQAAQVPASATVRKMDREIKHFVTDRGLSVSPGAAPNPAEVAHCEAWIKRFARPRKSINPDAHSYMLKHVCENWPHEGVIWPNPGGYCSNGAFIQAAVNLGYKILHVGRETSPNVCFNMSLRKRPLRRNELPNYLYLYLPWDDETGGE